MKLSKRRTFNDQFVCDLTKELDGITGMDRDHMLDDFYVHYLLIDSYTLKYIKEGIAIRVPGCTIGGIWIDENNIITRISINSNRIVKYPEDINEIMKKYIGVKIDHENLQYARSETV